MGLLGSAGSPARGRTHRRPDDRVPRDAGPVRTLRGGLPAAWSLFWPGPCVRHPLRGIFSRLAQVFGRNLSCKTKQRPLPTRKASDA